MSFQIKQIIINNFHPLEVVGRGSETQLQVGKNLNKTIKINQIKNNKKDLVFILNTVKWEFR